MRPQLRGLFCVKALFLKHLLLLISLCLTPIWVQAQATVCDETRGNLTRETYFSARLGQNMFYTVYTPPCYDANAQAYPVLYLMHGSNEDDGHWLRLGLPEILDYTIQSGDSPPMLAILPFGNVIANRNRFDNVSWANIFLYELMPHAEQNYNMSTEAADRGIGGISRGGFWAYQIAFSHPGLFSAVGGHSAFFDLYNAPDEYNPLALALNAKDIGSLRLWLDRGKDDFAAPGLEIMNERLTQAGFDHQYTIYPEGEHNNAYWSQHVVEYVAFYTAHGSQTAVEPGSQPGMFATNTPIAPQATTIPENTDSNDSVLYLPVVAFPGLQTNIASSQLQSVADGNYDENLVLTATVFSQLQLRGINLYPDIRLVEASELRETLWKNREEYTLLPMNEITLDYHILFVDDAPILDHLESYPFAGDDSHLTRITLSGVTALTRNTRVALSQNGLEWAAEAISPYAQSANFFHMSNEVSLIESCPQSNGDLLGGSSSFCSQPEHFQLFNLLDVDILELTGNHNNDYGYQTYRDSLAFYHENQIATIGGGETLAKARQPLILSHNGNTIGLLACNAAGPYYALVNEDQNALGGIRPGAAACDWDWLETEIPIISQQVDVMIVTVQHVEIEDYLPGYQQQIDFRRIANLGADVVIGTQAHKPQTFEFYPTRRGETALIHYGLGNLFFDQTFWGNQRFFMDTLYIESGTLRGIELFTGIIEDSARPRLMTPEERTNFLFFILVQQNGF
jgi:enterochelin esterase-like enzyme